MSLQVIDEIRRQKNEADANGLAACEGVARRLASGGNVPAAEIRKALEAGHWNAEALENRVKHLETFRTKMASAATLPAIAAQVASLDEELARLDAEYFSRRAEIESARREKRLEVEQAQGDRKWCLENPTELVLAGMGKRIGRRQSKRERRIAQLQDRQRPLRSSHGGGEGDEECGIEKNRHGVWGHAPEDVLERFRQRLASIDVEIAGVHDEISILDDLNDRSRELSLSVSPDQDKVAAILAELESFEADDAAATAAEERRPRRRSPVPVVGHVVPAAISFS